LAWTARGCIAMTYLKDYEEAMEAFRGGIAAAPEDVSLRIGLGQAAVFGNEYQVAQEALKKAVELDPGNASAWLTLGYVLEVTKAVATDVESAYRRAVEIDPKLMSAWYRLAEIAAKDGMRRVEAEASYRKAFALDPSHVQSKLGLGNLLLLGEASRSGEAAILFREILKDQPDLSAAVYGLVRANLRTLDGEAGAIKLTEAWLVKHPDDVEIRVCCAAEILRLKKNEQFPWAIRLAREAVELSPSFELSMLNCTLLAISGRPAESISFYRSVLEYPNALTDFETVGLGLPLMFLRSGVDPESILQTMVDSPAAAKLEVVITAFRLHLKQEVRAPAEVLAVAQDIARRFAGHAASAG
jgi:tetratricopeptide (TPR) repeat protein